MTTSLTPSPKLSVVSLLKNLAYLHGYKSAVFDSQYRFTRPKDPSAVLWKHEERVLNEIAVLLWELLEREATISEQEIEAEFQSYLAKSKAQFGSESPRYACAVAMVERLFGTRDKNARQERLSKARLTRARKPQRLAA